MRHHPLCAPQSFFCHAVLWCPTHSCWYGVVVCWRFTQLCWSALPWCGNALRCMPLAFLAPVVWVQGVEVLCKATQEQCSALHLAVHLEVDSVCEALGLAACTIWCGAPLWVALAAEALLMFEALQGKAAAGVQACCTAVAHDRVHPQDHMLGARWAWCVHCKSSTLGCIHLLGRQLPEPLIWSTGPSGCRPTCHALPSFTWNVAMICNNEISTLLNACTVSKTKQSR
jgi:hypothetical protein